MTFSELISTGELTLYHGTNAKFSEFSLEFAARPSMSGNGHLGVWLAVKRELAQEFGSLCLEVKAKVTKAYRMRLRELIQLNDACARAQAYEEDMDAYMRQLYTAYRKNLISEGYNLILLEEKDGRVDIAIGLVPADLTIKLGT